MFQIKKYEIKQNTYNNSLYKETKEDKWLHRAVQFAEFMDSKEFLTEAREPDHPNSLFEGAAAAACLYADLIEPEKACFPLFDLP